MNAVASRNVKFISHSDQGGRGDGVQIMVHRGYAYIGHGYSNGITVIDVRDPKNPRPVVFMPCPPNTRAIHLQTHDDLLLAVNGPSMWTMQVDAQAYYSGSPADLLKGQPIHGRGSCLRHRAARGAARDRLYADRGRGAASHLVCRRPLRLRLDPLPEFSDQVLAIVDMAEPTRPEVAGKWWIPGMWTGGGETPSWPKGSRYALHHALVAGDLAYGAWRDGGLTVLDVGDPARPKLLAYRNLDPPFGGGTHSPLPLPDRNLLVLADEANFADCSLGLRHTWVFDVREPAIPSASPRCQSHPRPTTAPRAAISGRTIFGRTGRALSRAHVSSLRPITMPGSGCLISRTHFSRAKPGSSCRPIQSACSTRGPIGRKSSSRRTALWMRRA